MATTRETKRCAVYTRKSTVRGLEQEFNTLDAQREAGVHYIRARAAEGWELLETRYDDGGFSGSNTDRPAFQRLLADIDAGEVDVVVAYKIDRISRSILDFAELMDRFQKAGVDLILVTQNFSTADAIGRLTLNMLMSFAQFEREQTAERTRDKMAAMRRQGRWAGGRAPYGYELVEGKLIPVEGEAFVVRTMFAQYLSLRSVRAVANYLNEHGHTTRRLAKPRKEKVCSWNSTRVLPLLRSQTYIGKIVEGDEVFDGIHEPLISASDFRTTQALLDKLSRGKRGGGRVNDSYLLRGLVRCDMCGAAMTPTGIKNGPRRYRYYRCATADKQGPSGCESRRAPAGELERVVMQQVAVWAADDRLAEVVLPALSERAKMEQRNLEEERAHHGSLVAKLRRELQQLTDVVAKQGDGAEGALAKMSSFQADIADRERRVRALQNRAGDLQVARIDIEWVRQSLGEFTKLWELMTNRNRARLLNGLVTEVRFNSASGRLDVVRRDIEVPTSEPMGRTA